MAPFPRLLPDEWKSQMGFMESGHFRCAFEGNPQPIYFWLEFGPHDNLVVNMHNLLLASVSRHPWCPDSKSTCYLSDTYTQRETERAWYRFQGCRMCFKGSGHLTRLLLWGKLAMWAAGALRIAPTYASSVVTLQVYFPRSESPRRRRRGCHKWVESYRNSPTLRYLHRDREGTAPFSRLLPDLRLQNVFHEIRVPQSPISLKEACNVRCCCCCSMPHPLPQAFCIERIAPTYASSMATLQLSPQSGCKHLQSAALPLRLRHPCCLIPESGWNATYRKFTYLALLAHKDRGGMAPLSRLLPQLRFAKWVSWDPGTKICFRGNWLVCVNYI